MKGKQSKGQSILEYSILLVIIMAALMAVGTYFKRGVQGRWKSSVDDLGEQYDPMKSTGTITHTISSNSVTNVWAEAIDVTTIQTFREDSSESEETKTGSITVAPSE